MRTDTIPAAASSINAPTPTKGDVSPPDGGRLPPAAIAVAVAVVVAEAVLLTVAVAEGVVVAVGVVEVAVADAVPKDTSGR